jgi:hypothetical protein
LKGGYLGTFYIDSPAYSHISALIMTKQLLALHTHRDKVTEKAEKPIVEVLTDVINTSAKCILVTGSLPEYLRGCGV